jgi:hypothetical protein
MPLRDFYGAVLTRYNFVISCRYIYILDLPLILMSILFVGDF